jgi:hypothetical protein
MYIVGNLFCTRLRKEEWVVKGAMRSRNSKDMQCNCQETTEKTMIYKTPHRKLKIEQHETH